MKNQRSTQAQKRFGLRAAAAVLMMLIALTCCLAVSVSAATALTIAPSDLVYRNDNGIYTADFGTDADVTADFAVSPAWKQAVAPNADFEIKVASATLSSTKIGAASVTVTFALTGADAVNYSVSTVTVPAMVYATDNIPHITKDDLTFADGTYQNGSYVKVYNGADKLDVLGDITLDTTGFSLPAGVDIAIESATLNAATVSEANTLTVTFKLVDKDTTDAIDPTLNYTAPATIYINAKVLPKQIAWEDGTVETSFDLVYGQKDYVVDFKPLLPALKAADIVAGDTVNVSSATNAFNEITKKQELNATVNVVLDNANYTVAPISAKVTVNPIKLKVDWASAVLDAYKWGEHVSFPDFVTAYFDNSGVASAPFFNLAVSIWNEDGSAEMTNFKGDVGKYRFQITSPDAEVYELDVTYATFEIKPIVFAVNMSDTTYIGNADQTSGNNTQKFYLTVVGDLPEEIRNLIQYTCNGAAFNGTSAYGAHVITAILPTSPNYSFTVNGSAPADNKLTATMYVNRTYLATGEEVNTYDVVLVGKNGFSADIVANIVAPSFDRTVLRSFPIHTEFTLNVTGAAGNEGFVLYIPLVTELFGKNVGALTVDDLYVYEPANNRLVKATTAYSVTVNDSYFVVDGYTASQPITFVIAPEYHVPFFLTAPAIALIILAVLLLIVLMFFIGLKLLRIKANLKENETIVIDTVGEAYEGEDVVVEEGEETPAIDVDELAENLEAEAEEAADEEVDERTREAVDVTIQELAEEEEPAEEVVEEPVEEVVEEVVEEEPEAVETIAPVVAEEADEDEDDDNDDDNDEDDDEEGFGSFGPAGLKYIDVKADPEGYAALLEQESQGLITIVYRYRKSFTSRLIQSQGNAQDYYSEIKNRLLSYKGVKDRTSWNYDAYNRGRMHVAKINVKTKTVYLYIALNPEDLVDTKYNFVDVSSKKKYASVPVLLKIKGERKFKHALELIDMLCGEKLELNKLEGREAVDYRLPYKTVEEMVEDGVVKKLAAGVPVEGAAPAEEAVAVDAPAEETATEN